MIGRSFSFELVQSLLDRVDVDELCDVIEKAQRMGLIVSSADGPRRLFTSRTSSCVKRSSTGRQQRVAGGSTARRTCAAPIPAPPTNAGEIADHLLKAGAFADRRAGNRAHARWNGARGVGVRGGTLRIRPALARNENEPTVRAEILSGMATADHGLDIDEALARSEGSMSRPRSRAHGRSHDLTDGPWARRYRR